MAISGRREGADIVKNQMDNTAICMHLKPILDSLTANGATIERLETAWTNAELVVVLNKGLHPNAGEAEAKVRGLVFWKNDDAHYSIEYGFFCNEHKHSISWPQNEAKMDKL